MLGKFGVQALLIFGLSLVSSETFGITGVAGLSESCAKLQACLVKPDSNRLNPNACFTTTEAWIRGTSTPSDLAAVDSALKALPKSFFPSERMKQAVFHTLNDYQRIQMNRADDFELAAEPLHNSQEIEKVAAGTTEGSFQDTNDSLVSERVWLREVLPKLAITDMKSDRGIGKKLGSQNASEVYEVDFQGRTHVFRPCVTEGLVPWDQLIRASARHTYRTFLLAELIEIPMPESRLVRLDGKYGVLTAWIDPRTRIEVPTTAGNDEMLKLVKERTDPTQFALNQILQFLVGNLDGDARDVRYPGGTMVHLDASESSAWSLIPYSTNVVLGRDLPSFLPSSHERILSPRASLRRRIIERLGPHSTKRELQGILFRLDVMTRYFLYE